MNEAKAKLLVAALDFLITDSSWPTEEELPQLVEIREEMVQIYGVKPEVEEPTLEQEE
jgi:hypothetical protein